MTLSALDKLLIEVLGRQREDGRGAEFSEERIRAVLCEGKRFDDHEKFLLATSPLARDVYAQVLEEVEIEREASDRRWARAGVNTKTTTMLAASSEHYPLVIPSDDFSVTVRTNPLAQGWVITLVLQDKFLRNVNRDDVLALVDDQGNTWARGKLNDYGEVHSYEWPYGETPVERTRRTGFSLRVQHA